MYIAMNRFRIAKDRCAEFERVWKERETYLDEVPGFRHFLLLRGPEAEDHVLYASHTTWESRQAFVAWTESEAFRKAHGGARTPPGVVLGPPHFEGFEVVLEA
ncbi:MAG: antibiotic biosynthesis monooxygenase [Deltaproteobacteria bacterium]|nr:MAG: antibiotic biosynthesis monooxygenase [Deltaproteobacteria bacterium]